MRHSLSLPYIPRSTNSLRFSAAWVHVIAITFASLTSRYFERSRPLRSSSNARNSSSWVNIFSIYLLKTPHFSSLQSCYEFHTWPDNKVRELATVCLLWQHWTKALVWFDDIDISAFHSCVVVDLWQSLSEWHLLLSVCVLVCHRENVRAWIRTMNEH